MDRTHPPADSTGSPPGRFVIGIVHYDAYRDLDGCLASVARQIARPDGVLVVDCDGDPGRQPALRAAHPRSCFEVVPNRGYSAGANRVLEWARVAHPSVEFVLLLNADVELDPAFCDRLVRAMAGDPSTALATGKLVRPGGERLDSAGIEIQANRRMRDRGSEQQDRGQFDRSEYVFGATGAAMLIRRAALTDLAIEDEVFDEDFFLYHEDTDLSWRANLLGWKVLYEPSATAVHARGWRKRDRFEIPVEVRRHSFKNHYLQLVKNEPTIDLVRGLPLILGWEVLRLGFALIRDRDVLPAYRDAWRAIGPALHKRRILQRRIRESRRRTGRTPSRLLVP